MEQSGGFWGGLLSGAKDMFTPDRQYLSDEEIMGLSAQDARLYEDQLRQYEQEDASHRKVGMAGSNVPQQQAQDMSQPMNPQSLLMPNVNQPRQASPQQIDQSRYLQGLLGGGR